MILTTQNINQVHEVMTRYVLYSQHNDNMNEKF
jgi:hypothetical protein